MTAATLDTPKDQLNLAELRTELSGLGEKLNGLRKMDRNSESVRTDAKQAIDDIKLLDAILLAGERAQEQRQPQAPAGTGPQVGTGQLSEKRAQSPGEEFTNRDEFRNFASRPSGSIEFEVRTLLTNNDGTANGGLFLPVAQPLYPRPIRQRLFIRDLLSSQPTGLSHIPYIRETGNAADDALVTTVAEAGLKPEVQMRFVLDDAPVRKIAGWIPVTTELLTDATTVRGYIDNRLDYMIRLREEGQLLNGDGVIPNIKGIRQFPGLQTQNDVAGAVTLDPVQLMGLAAGKVELVGGEIDGYAMNPADYWAMITTRYANQLDGGFSTGSPFNAPSPTIWGNPVVRTPSMPVTRILAGSWGQGATVFDRENVTIRVGDQHSDYFINNKVVILAEKREALAVFRPDFFCEINTTPVP